MIVTRSECELIAQKNPRLALVLWRDKPRFKPVSYEVKATFTTGTAGVPVEAAFQQRIFNDAWVQGVSYTIQRPNYQSSSPLRGWFEEFNKRNPGIDVLGKIDAEDQWDFSLTAMPIETLFAPCNESVPDGFMRFKGMVIPARGTPWMTLTLTRTLAEGEYPMNVRIAFSVLELWGCHYGNITQLDAIAQLKAMGFGEGSCCSTVKVER